MSQDYLLAASILAADFLALGDAIRQAEAGGADWIHIDVMDGHFVPNLTMGPVIVKACRRATTLPLDVHLMIERPETLLQAFAEAGADSVTVHREAVTDLHRMLESIRELGMRAGVALNPGTAADSIAEILGNLDLINVMTVNPGFAGQRFIGSVAAKIQQLRAWQESGRTSALIQVDGGINTDTAQTAARAGAQVYVAAHAVFRYPEGIGEGLRALRRALEAVAVQS